jgi:hypothetical protein
VSYLSVAWRHIALERHKQIQRMDHEKRFRKTGEGLRGSYITQRSFNCYFRLVVSGSIPVPRADGNTFSSFSRPLSFFFAGVCLGFMVHSVLSR